METSEIPYLSHELDLFQNSIHWKQYFTSALIKYVGGRVLEVGAGIGSNIPFLINASVQSYTCLEPDFNQAEKIRKKIAEGKLPANCNVKYGVLQSDLQNEFDTILYLDVLEHIEKDQAELQKASMALTAGGYLCILVPANPNSFSAFDHAIGHYRRYSRQMLLSILPPSVDLQWCRYLDSLGALSSKMNKYWLKQDYPSIGQIKLWDNILVPISRCIDPLLRYRIGKSLLMVARKKQSN
jgi:SAM-dependent methyltransferase